MIRYLLIAGLVVCLLMQTAHSAEIDINRDLIVVIKPTEGWVVHLRPPEALVKEAASHIAHEPAAANATSGQIEEVARQRLAANEAIVYHAPSGAHLDIDFSPLSQGEPAPDAQSLEASARFAAQSLAREMDVSAATWQVEPVEIKGLRDAFQILADYRKHDLAMKFIGIIGYVDGYWVFLYYTDPLKDPAAFGEMQAILKQLTVSRKGQ